MVVKKKPAKKKTVKKTVKKLTAAQKKALLAKKKKELLDKKTKEAIKSVDKLIKDLKKKITSDFGKVKIKYREGVIIKKMRRDAASGLRKIAMAIEGKKVSKKK